MDSVDRGLNEPAPTALTDHGRREPPARRRPSPRRVRAQAPTEERRPRSAAGWRRARPGGCSCPEAGRASTRLPWGPTPDPPRRHRMQWGWTGSEQEADRDHTAGQ
jgi:hypothetical protein